MRRYKYTNAIRGVDAELRLQHDASRFEPLSSNGIDATSDKSPLPLPDECRKGCCQLVNLPRALVTSEGSRSPPFHAAEGKKAGTTVMSAVFQAQLEMHLTQLVLEPLSCAPTIMLSSTAGHDRGSGTIGAAQIAGDRTGQRI